MNTKSQGPFRSLKRNEISSQLSKLFANVNYVILFIIAIIVPLSMVLFGVKSGFVFLGVIIGLPVVLLSMTNLKFGVVFIFILSFFLQGFNKYTPGIPLGISLDILILSMFIGLIIKKRRNFDFLITNNPIGLIVIIWILYNVFEIFNPLASIIAWAFVIRGLAILLLLYFIIANTLDSKKFFVKLIWLWVSLTLVGALYGLKQEFFGLSGFEMDWVTADPFRFKLIFNWGKFRIFSFFNDPAAFGILTSYTGLFCLILSLGPFKYKERIFYFVSSMIMLLAMVYTGTRTAYVMFPAGFLFFALISFRINILVVTFVLTIIGASIVLSDISSLGPLKRNQLERIRSAFNPSDDPSYNVRQRSQAFIQPYIQQHPIGAGLGSIGIWGERFNPDSELSEFAPDSGFVRIAVELGWIGLLLYCTFFFVIMSYGVSQYFIIQDPEIKFYMSGFLSVIFALVLGNFPQQVLIQVPTITIFYMIMAMIVKANHVK